MGKQALLDKAADYMSGSYVDLLDQRRRIRGRSQAHIAARRHFAAGHAGEADSDDPLLSCNVDRSQDVR